MDNQSVHDSRWPGKQVPPNPTITMAHSLFIWTIVHIRYKEMLIRYIYHNTGLSQLTKQSALHNSPAHLSQIWPHDSPLFSAVIRRCVFVARWYVADKRVRRRLNWPVQESQHSVLFPQKRRGSVSIVGQQLRQPSWKIGQRPFPVSGNCKNVRCCWLPALPTDCRENIERRLQS